jgi:holliday junction DNA helicase RuvA
MISSLRGTVLAAAGTTAVVEVHGIGYSVQVTPAHALSLRVGGEAMIRTALIVREDDLSLFGFEDAERLEMFDLLCGVTGVGPKSALGVLATLDPDEIADAVRAEDDAPFRRVSGIGPKTAKLIVVSLTGKITAAPRRAAPGVGTRLTVADSVAQALQGLGWTERTAVQAAAEAVEAAADTDRTDVQAVLRLALAELGPRAAAR